MTFQHAPFSPLAFILLSLFPSCSPISIMRLSLLLCVLLGASVACGLSYEYIDYDTNFEISQTNRRTTDNSEMGHQVRWGINHSIASLTCPLLLFPILSLCPQWVVRVVPVSVLAVRVVVVMVLP